MTKNNRLISASFAAVAVLALIGQPIQVWANEDKPAQLEKQKEEKDHVHKDGDGHAHKDDHDKKGHAHDEKEHKDGETVNGQE